MKVSSGSLFKEDGQVYVLLHTALGWILICLTDLQCFGVPRKNQRDAVDGLTPLGLKLDVKNSVMRDNDID